MFAQLKLTFSAFVFTIFCVGQAQAGLITFNLAGNSGDGAEGALLDNLASGTVAKGGVSAFLNAALTNPNRRLNQTGSAFGVNLLGDGCDVSGQIDNDPGCGTLYSEEILFSFDRMVKLVSLTLTLYSPSDNAELLFENTATDILFGSLDLPSTPSTLSIGAPVGGLGNRFTIYSRVGNGFSLDRFTIEVPAPATLALFGLGLAGLGWSRRKV